MILFASSQKEDEMDSLIDKEGKNRYGVTRFFFFGNPISQNSTHCKFVAIDPHIPSS